MPLTLALTDADVAALDAMVAAGGFASREEAAPYAVTMFSDDDDDDGDLLAMIDEGIADADAGDVEEVVSNELRTRFAVILPQERL